MVPGQVAQSKWRREETVEMSQIWFSDKVVDSSCTTENRKQRTDATGAVLESEAKANPNPESSEEDRNLTVTACTGTDTIQDRAHDAGKDLRKARYSQSDCCQDCQRSSQSLEHRMSPVRDSRDHPSRLDQAGNGDAGGSRAQQTFEDCLQSEGDQQSEINKNRTVLNNSHQFKIPEHMLNRKTEAHKTSQKSTMSRARNRSITWKSIG